MGFVVTHFCYDVFIALGSHVRMRPRMTPYIVTSVESQKELGWIGDNV